MTALLSASAITLWDLTAGLKWRHPWADMPQQARRMAAAEAAPHCAPWRPEESPAEKAQTTRSATSSAAPVR